MTRTTAATTTAAAASTAAARATAPTEPPAEPPTGTDPLTRAQGIALLDGWTRLWNSDLALADGLIAPEFRLRFANSVPGTGSGATLDRPNLTAFIRAHRQEHPGLMYAVDGPPVVDGARAEVAARWTATYTDGAGHPVTKSGIDLLAITDGRIAAVWSLTGDRRFAP
ncbi:nuclear transport factor 2 family protein [Streptomyces sp. NBC_00239]|uniref:nuclear transport factor 2 family protein n=1 Tax=Streptomyces sp. NBC_00239 TaxID=2903640 RepID=UPI002E2D907A|nr:nuclear transport factor 2 family protein [Streptomyces sp. NBC_00239]